MFAIISALQEWPTLFMRSHYHQGTQTHLFPSDVDSGANRRQSGVSSSSSSLVGPLVITCSSSVQLCSRDIKTLQYVRRIANELAISRMLL
jgi:hypothetical protein